MTKYDIKEMFRRLWKSPMMCAVCDILWIYVLMEVTRLVFLWENIGTFRITTSSFMLISHGGLLFDTSAIMYVNALWLVLAFLPLHRKERPGWWKSVKWTYVITNSTLCSPISATPSSTVIAISGALCRSSPSSATRET